MKTHEKIALFAVLMGMVPSLVAAETLDESVNRQIRQAEIDRAKVPVYAITTAALKSGVKIPGMPPELLNAARETANGVWTEVTVGKSQVTIKNNADVVTFEFDATAQSAIDPDGKSYFSSAPDPMRQLLGWTLGTSTKGIVFEKTTDETWTAVPSFMSCGTHYKACDRFGFGDEPARIWKTEEDKDNEQAYLSSLIAKYGKNGVLYRKELKERLEASLKQIDELVAASKDGTGFIKYDAATDTYRPVIEHLMEASIFEKDSHVTPDGKIKLAFEGYDHRIARVAIQLYYQDGTAMTPTDIGNMARVDIGPEDLGDYQKGLSLSAFPVMVLPPDLKPLVINIVASALDANGKILVKDEVIGTFTYTLVALQ